jgi:hypothetical protein
MAQAVRPGEAPQPFLEPSVLFLPNQRGEFIMADGNGGGGNSALALLVGILLVIVLIGGFFLYTGGHFGGPASTTHTVNLNVKAPAKPGGG